MAERQPIVRKCGKISKARLHDLLMVGWSRCVANYGRGAFTEALEISTVALDKQFAGSMPGFDLIVDAACIDPHVLDEVMAELGKQVVDRQQEADADDLTVALAKLLLWVSQAEHPDSPGGRRIVHSEIAAAEPVLRDLHKITGDLLNGLTNIRKPRSVA